MELELQGWKLKAALVALIAVVVAVPLLRAVKSNKDRAEDWHRRAIVAEQAVGGLRFVIADRSRALNQRTVQANQLLRKAQSNGTALRQTKVSVGTLTRRRQELASENARLAKQHRQLQRQLARLEAVARQLGACARASAATGTKSADARSRRASCTRASASLNAYLGQSR